MDEVHPVEIRFPTMLRKMWSGGEVQEWIDALEPLYPQSAIDALRAQFNDMFLRAREWATYAGEIQADIERLNWLEENPNAIVRTTGYRGLVDTWALRRDGLPTEDFASLRDAIDAGNPRYTITEAGRAMLEAARG